MVAHAFVHDGGTHLRVKQSVVPQVADGNVTGVAVDRWLYHSAQLVIQTGAVSGSPDSFVITAAVEHSDDGDTGWEVVNGLSATVDAADSVGFANIQLGELKRFARIVLDVDFEGGTTPDVAVAAALVGVAGQDLPAREYPVEE